MNVIIKKGVLIVENQIDEIEELEANFYLLERQLLNEFGYMLPYFKE